MNDETKVKHARCKDPCDLIMRHGREAFQRVIDRAVPIMEYKWKQLVDAQGDSISTNVDAVRAFLAFLRVKEGQLDPIKKGQILIKLSSLSGIAIEELRRMLEDKSPQKRSVQAAPVMNGRDIAERWLLGCILHDPSIYFDLKNSLHIGLFQHWGDLSSRLFEFFEHEFGATAIREVVAYIDEEAPEYSNEVILLEKAIDDWLNPPLSPQLATAAKQSMAARGITVASVARDMIAVLQMPHRSAVV